MEYQILVVDEEGNALAESKELFQIERALELLGNLPLRLGPYADQWLKDALGETFSAKPPVAVCR